jgi:hypothetical protein
VSGVAVAAAEGYRLKNGAVLVGVEGAISDHSQLTATYTRTQLPGLGRSQSEICDYKGLENKRYRDTEVARVSNNVTIIT